MVVFMGVGWVKVVGYRLSVMGYSLLISLVLPVEDLDVPGGDAEAVDGFRIPTDFFRGGPGGPIVDALLFSGDEGGFPIGGLDGGDVNGAVAAGFLTEHGEG
jgi:hypothetical protein